MEIKWHDIDPGSGERRYLCAERFAGVWRFRWKLQRRGEWTRGLEPTLAIWEHVLDTLGRRYRRREGVDDPDIAQVAKIVSDLRCREQALKKSDDTTGRRQFALAPARGFTAAEATACQRLVELAIAEDIGKGDVTSQAVIAADLVGRAVFVARSAGVLAGLPAAALVAQNIDPSLRFEELSTDGSRLEAGQRLARLAGSMRAILTAERIALNFLQHLSGVASLTRKYVDAVAGTRARILDTRKTLPGWRLLQKYAVRCGGGHNHRMGLFDGVLIKDNHLAALSISEAVRQARQTFPDLPVEIEVENLNQLDDALSCRPDIVLLDNMDLEMMREAVRRRDDNGQGVQLEASGGVQLHTVRAIAETGVDRISIGALTHSAPALDIALDFET